MMRKKDRQERARLVWQSIDSAALIQKQLSAALWELGEGHDEGVKEHLGKVEIFMTRLRAQIERIEKLQNPS